MDSLKKHCLGYKDKSGSFRESVHAIGVKAHNAREAAKAPPPTSMPSPPIINVTLVGNEKTEQVKEEKEGPNPKKQRTLDSLVKAKKGQETFLKDVVVAFAGIQVCGFICL